MKVNLNLSDRISLLNLIPIQGNIEQLKAYRKLRLTLQFKDSEREEFDIKESRVDGGGVRYNWSELGQVKREIELTGEEVHALVNILRDKDAKKELTDDLVDAYTEIIGAENATQAE